MTLALIEKGLLLEGWSPKIEDKQVPGIYIYIIHLYNLYTTQKQKQIHKETNKQKNTGIYEVSPPSQGSPLFVQSIGPPPPLPLSTSKFAGKIGHDGSPTSHDPGRQAGHLRCSAFTQKMAWVTFWRPTGEMCSIKTWVFSKSLGWMFKTICHVKYVDITRWGILFGINCLVSWKKTKMQNNQPWNYNLQSQKIYGTKTQGEQNKHKKQ